jgi:hypothetical protein
MALFIGRLQDPIFKAKMLRLFLRKNYGCVGFFSRDTKDLRLIVINFDRDIIKLEDKMWVAVKNRFYRLDKPERGIDLKKPDLPIRWNEGVPVVFVNADSFVTMDIAGENTEVKPDEINAALTAWEANQRAKVLTNIMGDFNKIRIFVLIVAGLSLASAVLGFVNMNNSNNLAAQHDAIQQEVHQICLKTGACIPPQQNATTQPTKQTFKVI